MLEVLKEQLRVDKTVDIVMEAASDDNVRDIFLDSFDAIVLGAENDPEINKLIDNIPAYDETDPQFAKEIEAMAESALFELE